MPSETENYEGFIDLGVDLDNVHEPEPVPTGAYDLSIENAVAKHKEQQDGSNPLASIQVRITIEGHPTAATVFHNLSLPLPGDEPKKAQFKGMLIKKFYKLFNVAWTSKGINTQDLLGARATAANLDLVKTQPQDGSEGRFINQINLNSVKV